MSLRHVVRNVIARLGYQVSRLNRDYPFPRPVDPLGVAVLADPAFQASCKMISTSTLLDTPRLANLWMLCQLTDPAGAIAEIGTYRGGGALHLSNCAPGRQIVVCDPFSDESFDALHPTLDRTFRRGQFAGHREAAVRQLLAGRPLTIVPGYFPASVRDLTLPRLSFVHLDVDAYQATKESLLFLLHHGTMLPQSLIVLDDYNRNAHGVNQAVTEVRAETPGTLVFPLFPGQALIVPRSWRSEPDVGDNTA